jgi:hypothetical protein
MKAAVTNDEHGFDVVDMPDPTPGPDELVIRVAACGVCGSDIKAQPLMPAGMVMGHELGGAIVAVGSRADGWQRGVKVAVLPVISCGNCPYCSAGVVSHCAQSSYMGMGPAGGFAEFAVVPARHAFAVTADMPDIYSALVEPFAVGLHGVHSAEFIAGESVLVVGAGGVGLTTVAWLSAKGAGRVTAADPDPPRRAFECVRRPTPGMPGCTTSTGSDRDLRCMRGADTYRTRHRAPQGTHDSVLRLLPTRRVPPSGRGIRQRSGRSEAHGGTHARNAPSCRRLRARPQHKRAWTSTRHPRCEWLAPPARRRMGSVGVLDPGVFGSHPSDHCV